MTLLAMIFASSLAAGVDASEVPTPPRTIRVAGTPDVRVVRYGDDRLSGITAVDVVVQEMRAEACGLTQGALQETAVTALRASGTQASVSAKASSWFYTVYVTAESSEESGRCVTSLTAELVAQVQGIPDAERSAPPDRWGSLLVGEMPLVRHSGLVSSTRAEHAARVDAVVREQLSAIGARIRAVNVPQLRP